MNSPNVKKSLLATACVILGACPKEKAAPSAPPEQALPGATAYSQTLQVELRRAFDGQGKAYKPRTHHLLPGGLPKYINRLIRETSPYLLQHAHNPVNWFAWGEEAFAEARRLGRPIFLSVGYSTCHWCHVMERESFEDEEIAAFMNQHFVAIKVDREERPDVDGVYMTAVQMMTGRGGWPMSVVMTPDGRPFFGGTYFPARDGDRGAKFGFFTLLKQLSEGYANEREDVLASAERLMAELEDSARHEAGQTVPRPAVLVESARMTAQNFDPVYGGFGRAPKFPRPSTYELMLRYWVRTNDPGALHIVTHSLEQMMQGGIYDHLAGGFARYSTDQRWLVPHFEKMLYDNAQLVSLLVDTWQATADGRFRAVAVETLEYALREMRSPEGAFYSATDADSEGEEGTFFVWTPAQIAGVIGSDRAKIVNAYYAVTAAGNFEGKNILSRPQSDEGVAASLGIEVQALRAEIERSKSELYAARQKRVHPLLDDKILTEWNAQMIGALAKAGFAFSEPRYIQAAESAAGFLLERLQKDDRLLRAYRVGRARHDGVLEDYAFTIAALIDLYEATGATRWLQAALSLEKTLEAQFSDPTGGFFATAKDAEVLLVREKKVYDGAQPSGNAVAAMNLLRIAELRDDGRARGLAESTLRAFAGTLERGASECPKLAQSLDWVHDRPKQIVLVTHESDDGAALREVLRQRFVPNKVLVQVAESDVKSLSPLVPLVAEKRAIDGKATAYVCYRTTCKKPTSSPAELATQLDDREKIAAEPLAVRRP